MRIVEGHLENGQVQAMLRDHLDQMHKNTPSGAVAYALDLSGIEVPEVSFYTAWHDDELLGMGALKEIACDAGEIKSMRTHARHLRKGIASVLLSHMIETAKQRHYKRLSLETGSGPIFEPALTFYRSFGFVDGGAFGDYEQSDFNRFLHLEL